MKKVLRFLLCGVVLVHAVWAGGDAERERLDYRTLSFEEIETLSRDTTVRFYLWGGSDAVNGWIDRYVAPIMRERYQITVERVPMDASVFVNKLITERQAEQWAGTIDVVWINGENFRNARQAEILFGPFTDLLPNFTAYVDPTTAENDAGYPVEGYEAPWGRAQFTFDVDGARVEKVPTSFAGLRDWVKRNPGRFTYPQPPDFTGSAFVRQLFYALTGGWQQYAERYDEDLYARRVGVVWEYLNEIEPYLWQEGQSYPRDLAALDALFERGEVDFTMSFTQTNAATRIRDGRYPPSVRSFVMDEGSLYNTHFLAIPFNAPNTPGALTLVNELLSPEAQLSKNRLENWGDFTVLSMNRLSHEMQTAFATLDLGDATVSLDRLSETGVPEIPAPYWEALERGWDAEVRLR